MRRFVLVLVMMILAFQSTWAAAANLCAHEQGGGGHFGHHEHRHIAASTADDSAADEGGTGGYHADCATCHGHCSSAATSIVRWASAAVEDAPAASRYLRHAPDRSPDNPLRPPSTHLA